MGNTIWVDIHGRGEGEEPSDSSIMLRLEKPLEKLAQKLGVTKLTDFYDYSVLEDEFADLLDEVEEDEETAAAGEDRGNWFDPARILLSVRSIREHLEKHPEDLGYKPDASTRHFPADLMEELNEAQALLERAVTKRKLVRLLIVS